MSLLNDLAWFLLDIPIHLANGILLTVYWLVANLPALISIAAATLIGFLADQSVSQRNSRPLRGDRAGAPQNLSSAQIITAGVLGLWIAGQWGMAAPVPWIGTVMWMVGAFVVILIRSQQFNLLWFVKAGIAIYSLAVIAGRLYLSYTIQLTPEQWAALIGSTQSAAEVISNTRGNMTTIILWGLWLVIPLGFFSMLLQQVLLNPTSILRPFGGAEKAIEDLRYRRGR